MTGLSLDQDPLPQLGADPTDTQIAQQLADTHAIHQQAQLAQDVELAWRVALDLRSVDLHARVRGLEVWSATLSSGQPCATWTGGHGVVKQELTFCIELGLGEITMTGELCLLVDGAWRCKRYPTTVIAAWSPTLGAVGGDALAYAPEVNAGSAGSSRSVIPTITRIPVDAQPRIGTPVGGMVKAALFPDEPDFLFNVCFAVGPFLLFRPGAYGDPSSPWFNVFTGYYQIDCPKPAWTRPFGYASTSAGAAIQFDELLRLGKADWNYFSNWMYGVPIADVTPYNQPDPGVITRSLGRVTVGQSSWDQIDLDGFSTVTAYQATSSTQLADNTVLTPLWRIAYGEAAAVSGFDTSFIGARMHARLYMAWHEDASAFHTCLFGGTVNKAFDQAGNPDFLATQLAACAKVIGAHYPTLGFPAS